MLQRAFTLIELLVSLSVLLVVIIATSRIFGTTGKVAAIGEASADLQATATAVEKVIRGDIERIARDGVLAIQCVAVQNDVNRTATYPQAPLLDPTREITDFVRCDQVVFFGRGHEVSQVYLGTRGGSRSDQAYVVNLFSGGQIKITPEFTSNEFMIRLGHGLQFPTLLVDSTKSPPVRPDAAFIGTKASNIFPLVPWMWSPTATMTSAYFDSSTENKLTYLPNQPEARQWVLARQCVLLTDDGVNTSQFPSANNLTWFREREVTGAGTAGSAGMIANSTTGIAQYSFNVAGDSTPNPAATNLAIPQDNLFPNRALTASRVDIAATTIGDFRALIEQGATSAYFSKDFNFDSSGRLPWSEKEGTTPDLNPKTSLGYIRNRIYNALFGAPIRTDPTGLVGTTNGLWGYPRAEKVAPSVNRLDAMTNGPLLAGNCSSIQIDWTWSNRTAQFETPEGTPLLAQLPVTVVVPPLTPPRPNAICDVPLAGLTTQKWPANQPFKFADDSDSLPLNTEITPTTSGNFIPWFGLPDSMFPISQRRGVTRLAGPLISDKLTPLSTPSYATPIRILKPSVATDPANKSPFVPSNVTTNDIDTVAVATPPIDCARIEGFDTAILRPLGTNTQVYSYQAIFGPNGDKPYREAKFPGGSERVLRTDYTPWPTALRFTITLHDPKLALSQGRVFQFVVELPKAEK